MNKTQTYRIYILKFVLVLLLLIPIYSNNNSINNSWDVLSIGRLKYSGGGDWYSNPSSLPNLISYYNKTTQSKIYARDVVVSLKDASYKEVPIIYFTGHGKFKLEANEKKNLKNYLKNGGFLFADDNFGMDSYIRKELNSLFSNTKLKKISLNNSIFQYPYKMPIGLPKIHKHYGGAAIAYGLYLNNRMVAFYGYNTDLGDGWEDIEVHHDGPIKHSLALKMGVNVLWKALNCGL